MHVLGPIVLYLVIVAASAAAIMPLCRRVFDDARRVPLVAVSLTAGPPVALLVFSLVARLVPSYAVAVPITAALLALPWLLARVQQARDGSKPGSSRAAPTWALRADIAILATYAVLFAGLLWLRSRWPSIYWDNDYAHVGTEKLFNFTLLQSYVHGMGYPPENLWLAGQPIDYYVLLHALPGLAAWGWRALTGDGMSGSILFVFSDVFLLVLGSVALSAWSRALLASEDDRISQRATTLLGLALGLGVLVSTSGQAVGLVLRALAGAGEAPWWLLEREAVPYTYSQYPFYLLLQGDHHPFQRIFFLQISLYGVVLLVLQARRLDWSRALLAAMLASAVFLSHTGSVLLDLGVFGTSCMAMISARWWRREWTKLRVLLANLVATASLTLMLSLPALHHDSSRAIAWYWIDMHGSSSFGRFLLAQAGPLTFVFAALAAGVVTSRAARGPRPWPAAHLRTTLLIGASLIACLAFFRGGAAVALVCAFGTILLAPRRSAGGEDRLAFVALGASAFVIWLVPEFLVCDLAGRNVVEWKRWNFAMRLWLEGYYLVPFLAVLAFGPALQDALRERRYRRGLAAAAVVVAGLCVTTHVYSVVDRRARTPDVPGLDGAGFFARQFPCDAAIAAELAQLMQPVRIGELCGAGDAIPGVPGSYGWAGRIASFSGRPGICGWTDYMRDFTPRLRGASATGPWTLVRFREYERNLRDAYVAALHGGVAQKSRAFLDALDVTHVIVGDQEVRLFPGLTGRNLAQALGGQVVFERYDSCAVVTLAGQGDAGR